MENLKEFIEEAEKVTDIETLLVLEKLGWMYFTWEQLDILVKYWEGMTSERRRI